jgi:hypothetical protein
MKEVFVIEKLVTVGFWELFSDKFYTDERKAIDDCIDLMKKIQQINPNFAARVTKLELVN